MRICNTQRGTPHCLSLRNIPSRSALSVTDCFTLDSDLKTCFITNDSFLVTVIHVLLCPNNTTNKKLLLKRNVTISLFLLINCHDDSFTYAKLFPYNFYFSTLFFFLFSWMHVLSRFFAFPLTMINIVNF